MKVKLVLLLTALSVFASGVFAGPRVPPAWPYAAAQRPAIADAGSVVRSGIEQLLEFLNQKPRPSEMKVAAFLAEKITGSFDFDYMARSAVGPAFGRMNTEQRIALVQRIEQDFLETLANRLASFENQRVRYFRPRHSRGNRTSVTVGIANPGSYPTRLDFRLYRGKDGWRVYDVAANGNSAVNYYRQKLSRTWRRPAPPYPGRM